MLETNGKNLWESCNIINDTHVYVKVTCLHIYILGCRTCRVFFNYAKCLYFYE